MTAEQASNAGGPVSVGPLTFLVTELSVAGEARLFRRLRALATDALGPGGFFAAALPTLKWMTDNGHHADRAALLEHVGRQITGRSAVSPEAVEEFRQTRPEGVAEELFARTRRTHPEATRDELRAVVTAANAEEVSEQIYEALDPNPKAKVPSGATPS